VGRFVRLLPHDGLVLQSRGAAAARFLGAAHGSLPPELAPGLLRQTRAAVVVVSLLRPWCPVNDQPLGGQGSTSGCVRAIALIRSITCCSLVPATSLNTFRAMTRPSMIG
jgi:hypothetical protein